MELNKFGQGSFWTECPVCKGVNIWVTKPENTNGMKTITMFSGREAIVRVCSKKSCCDNKGNR